MGYSGQKSPSVLRKELESRCFDIGFTRIKVASVEGRAAGIDAYDRFLANGYHGDMHWMVRSRPPRQNIRELMPEAQSIMVLGIDYWHPRPQKPGPLFGRVSRYAWGRDYHNLVGKRLNRLSRTLRAEYSGLQVYFGVDSRPFIERAWAERAGLGFVGKNAMLISPSEGSYFFLAVLLLNVSLPADKPLIKDHCGRCVRCLTGCPTDAFAKPFQLDARKCISYWTIEKKGEIPKEHISQMGDWVFGCDDCQELCPHNHHPNISTEKDLAPRPHNAWLDLQWVLTASDEELLSRFEGSPLRRAGPMRLRRNALAVLGNSGQKEALSILQPYKNHSNNILSRHASWAEQRCQSLILDM